MSQDLSWRLGIKLGLLIKGEKAGGVGASLRLPTLALSALAVRIVEYLVCAAHSSVYCENRIHPTLEAPK